MAQTAEKIDNSPALSLTIERATFLKALGRVQSIIEKRNTIPILSNVKLEGEGAALRLTATDMDISVTETVPAAVETGGALTVPAGMLYDIIRKLPDGAQISLFSDAATGQLRVESGKAKFALSYLAADDFPVMTEGDLTHQFTISAADCAQLIEKTRFAMSSEETRYYLNGIYLHVAQNDKGEETLRAVATDGHRLARVDVPLPKGAAGMPGIIIPRKTVSELKKLTEEAGEEAQVGVSESKIRVTAGELVLLSKLIDGTFPDYERVIPAGNDKILEVDAKAFMQAVDRVSTITMEKTRAVKVALESGKLTITASSPEQGTAEEALDVTYAAEPMEIGFNARYVLEMMGELGGDTAQFLFSDPAAPSVVCDPADIGALYVLMPMRV